MAMLVLCLLRRTYWLHPRSAVNAPSLKHQGTEAAQMHATRDSSNSQTPQYISCCCCITHMESGPPQWPCQRMSSWLTPWRSQSS